MAEAALSLVAGPVISSVLQNVLGSSSGGGATGSNGGGLFGGLLNDFTSAFGGLFGSNSSNSMMGSPASCPMPYSTANMSQMAYNNPMSLFSSGFWGNNGGGTLGTGSSIASQNSAALNSDQMASDQATALAQQNPDNAADQADAANKKMALQVKLNQVLSDDQMFAQQAKEATQKSILS